MPHTIRTGQAILLRVEVVALAARVLDHRRRARRRPRCRGSGARAARRGCARSSWSMSCVARRRPSTEATHRLRVRRGRLHLLLHRRLEVERLLQRVVALRPAAGGRERHDRPARGRARRAAARRSRRASCRRCARSRSPRRPSRARPRRGGRRRVDLALERRPARVAEQRRGEHVVVALERRQHELPRPPRVGEAVQADQRRPGAAAVGRGEARVRQSARHGGPAGGACRGGARARGGGLGVHLPLRRRPRRRPPRAAPRRA